MRRGFSSLLAVPTEDGCFCLDASGGFLVHLRNRAVAPPSAGEEASLFVSVCAVEMLRVQDIQGKSFWVT